MINYTPAKNFFLKEKVSYCLRYRRRPRTAHMKARDFTVSCVLIIFDNSQMVVHAIIISQVHGDIGVSNREIINGVNFSIFFLALCNITNKISTSHLIRVLYSNDNNKTKRTIYNVST